MNQKIGFVFIFYQVFTIILVNCHTDFSKCGINTETAEHIIINYEVGAWPWMGSLGYWTDADEWSHQCGTSLISQTHFITAAQCVQDLDSNWMIRHGVSNLNQTRNELRGETITIEKVFQHPKYKRTAYFDIAVLQIAPVEFNAYLRPICLPKPLDFKIDKYDNYLSQLIGWGSEELGTPSPKLKRVILQIYEYSYCNSTHESVIGELQNKSYLAQLFQPNLLCAGYESSEQGSCKGDSGGPLMIYKAASSQYFQVGLVAGGISKCADKNVPFYFTRLDHPEIANFIANPDPNTTTLDLPFLAKGYKKILIGAGETESAKDIEVEIIDLESSSSNCSNLKDFPKATHGAISGLDFNDNPVICGGYGNRYKQECFSWSDSSWQVSSPLTQKRRYASSCPSPFPEESYKLMVVGGSDGSDNSTALNTVEVLTKDGWKTVLPSLPVRSSSSCMVLLNSSTSFLIGGNQDESYSSPNSYLLNTASNSQEWIKGPSLKFGREAHSCARIRKDSSSHQFSIIVVGGYNSNFAKLKSVEILDEGASEWRNGPDLPLEISHASMVEDPSGGVVLVGGNSFDNRHLKTLFSLSDAGDDAKWVEMPQKLKIGRYDHTAFLVPDDVATCSLL